MTRLSDFELGCDFYDYQQQALTSLSERFFAGQNQLLLLAPPGSGKTLIGLACALRFQQPTLILSPNTALQSQWLEQFSHQAVSVVEPSAIANREPVTGTEVQEQPEILSLTYQRIGAAFRQQQETGHPSLLFEQLKKYTFIILDECHHVLLQWGEALLSLIEQNPAISTTLGLTATPPIERKAHEQKRLWQLVGQIDYEISLPAMIRAGHLAPFQDLVYLVRPSPQEIKYIQSAHTALHEFQNQWTALSLFAESWLLENAYKEIHEDTKMTMACLRYLHHKGIYVAGMPWYPEQEEPLNMDDWAALLSRYALQFLDLDGDEFERFRHTLSLLGYRYRQGKFFSVQGEVEKVLGLSQAKMQALQNILQHEYSEQGEELRALVITDFALTSSPGERQALDGVMDPDAGGALGIFRYLCRVLPELRLVMMTGAYVFCHASVWPECLLFLNENAPDYTFETIPHTGDILAIQALPTWSPKDYVSVFTQFFETGGSLCLIGTRGLLGEGWNCQSLNTLIDLTRVTTYVSVNQIRGRSLRKDPERPFKVANQWDIVAMIPELESGFKDLEHWQRKHRHFYGLCDDGLIEKGVGHVHALFDSFEPLQLQHHMEHLNENALERAANRLKTYDNWKIGHAYKDREQHTLQIMSSSVSASVQKNALPLNTLPVEKQQAEQQLQWTLQNQSFQLKRVQLGLQVSLWSTALYLQSTLFLFMGIVTGIGLLIGHYFLKRNLMYRAQQDFKTPQASLLQALAQALWAACWALDAVEGEDQVPKELRVLIREEGAFRFVSDASVLQHQIWQQAFQELLSPLLSQRYWLQLTLSSEQQGETYFLPVPFVFGRSREKALLFKTHIEKVMGDSVLVFTRRGQGREIAKAYQMKRCLPVKFQGISVWS